MRTWGTHAVTLSDAENKGCFSQPRVPILTNGAGWTVCNLLTDSPPKCEPGSCHMVFPGLPTSQLFKLLGVETGNCHRKRERKCHHSLNLRVNAAVSCGTEEHRGSSHVRGRFAVNSELLSFLPAPSSRCSAHTTVKVYFSGSLLFCFMRIP